MRLKTRPRMKGVISETEFFAHAETIEPNHLARETITRRKIPNETVMIPKK